MQFNCKNQPATSLEEKRTSVKEKVICDEGLNFFKLRQEIRKFINVDKTVYFVVDYAKAMKMSSEKIRFELDLYNNENDVRMPILIFEDAEILSIYTRHLLKSLFRSSYNLQNARMKEERGIIGERKITQMYYRTINESNACSLILKVCKVSSSNAKDSTFDISEEIILFTHGESVLGQRKIIEECLPFYTHMQNLTFDEFEVQGFAICKHLNYYINECKYVKREPARIFSITAIASISFCLIIFIFIAREVAIFLCTSNEIFEN
jgi:hypothetical protein